MIVSSRKDNAISYVNKLINEVNIHWTEEAHKTYISAIDKVIERNFSFNLLGFIDIFTYVMFSGYLQIDMDAEGKSIANLTISNGDTIDDIKGITSIIETSADCTIQCGGK